MRGVGDELADLGLAGLAGGQRLLDVVQHVVERLPDPADLGRGVGVGRRDAYGQGHLAAVQRQLGDLLGGGRHPVERPQAADHHGPGGDDSAGHGQQGEQRLQPDELDQQAVDLGQRQPDHDRARLLAAGLTIVTG